MATISLKLKWILQSCFRKIVFDISTMASTHQRKQAKCVQRSKFFTSSMASVHPFLEVLPVLLPLLEAALAFTNVDERTFDEPLTNYIHKRSGVEAMLA